MARGNFSDSMMDLVREGKTQKPSEEKKEVVEKKKEEAVEEVTTKSKISQVKEENKEPEKKAKHPGGRKNIRGVNGKDYKMLNVAVPSDVYEKLKAASNGNMTFFVNAVLRESVGM